MELGFEPGTLVPRSGMLLLQDAYLSLRITHSGKGNDGSVSQLNTNEAQRGLIDDWHKVIQQDGGPLGDLSPILISWDYLW